MKITSQTVATTATFTCLRRRIKLH